MSYLADQYGKNDRLYPKTPTGLALVNQRLHFDIGTLYKAVKDYYASILAREVHYFHFKKFKGH